MFVDVSSGCGLVGVEVRIEAVEAIVDVFLLGGYAAIRPVDTWEVIFVDAVVYHMRNKGGWELTSSVRRDAP